MEAAEGEQMKEEQAEIRFRPIGRILSRFKEEEGTPIQSALIAEEEGIIEIFPEFALGLRDLEHFERLWVVYHLDRTREANLLVHPYLAPEEEHGVFATRSPARPNPIGIAAPLLLSIHDNRLRILGVDMLDQTPVLDIKPYIPKFDSFTTENIGWYRKKIREGARADKRFEQR